MRRSLRLQEKRKIVECEKKCKDELTGKLVEGKC
jgi:hypothetical protein